MKRLFIAIKVFPDGELLRMVSSLKSLLGNEKIKWVDPANIHITLAFLGDTDEKKIKILTDMLQKICSGFHEFEFELAGAGVFKNFREPRVIWVGIRSVEMLTKLYNLINEGLQSAGFETDGRDFRPHLTLGRIKSVNNTETLKAALGKYREVEFQKVEVKEVILFESILLQRGPVYKPLVKFCL
jgi:2'-5' RNA ligase